MTSRSVFQWILFRIRSKVILLMHSVDDYRHYAAITITMKMLEVVLFLKIAQYFWFLQNISENLQIFLKIAQNIKIACIFCCMFRIFGTIQGKLVLESEWFTSGCVHTTSLSQLRLSRPTFYSNSFAIVAS